MIKIFSTWLLNDPQVLGLSTFFTHALCYLKISIQLRALILLLSYDIQLIMVKNTTEGLHLVLIDKHCKSLQQKCSQFS